jgi:hypothetical protein
VAEEDVPADVRQYAEEIGASYGWCPETIEAICMEETHCNPNAVNYNGTCHGIMQVYVRFHKSRMEKLGVSDIYDTYGNMLVAVDYLSELSAAHEDIGEVLLIYSGNAGMVSRYQETGRMTSYAERVLARSERLERLHSK